MSAETSLYPEDQCSGHWKLQSYEEPLCAKMRHRCSEKSSPWTITGTPGNSKSPWIFRRSFASSENARKSLERILMRLDAEDYEIVHEGHGKGFVVKRPSGGQNLREVHARLTENRQCHTGEKSAA